MNDNNLNNNKALADLLFASRGITLDSSNDRKHFESLHTKRDTSAGQEYMRLAPSPTGELHAGALYLAIINDIVSHKSGGKFIIRIEDTDTAREIPGAREKMLKLFDNFDFKVDESPVHGGDHGPYIQSERASIYDAFVYDFISRGYAYPCFMTPEELDAMREEQTVMKMRPGMYGRFAKYQDITYEDVKERLDRGEKYVIRLRSSGDFDKKITFVDEIMGKLELSENDEHLIIAKGDGIPTYHLAHLVDDYLMGVTFVLRANEWVASITKHLELWDKLGAKPPKYGHIMPINKKDGDSIRKLSKRKDPEASVEYYVKEGYTVEALKSYLIRLANPSFDEWWDKKVKENDVDRKVKIDYKEYEFIFDELKRNSRGPLLDFDKLGNLSADFVASLSADEVLSRVLAWAKEYDPALYEILNRNTDYTLRILNIEREGESKRKDIKKWSDVRESVFYFFDDLFASDEVIVNCDPLLLNKIKVILSNDIHYSAGASVDEWIAFMKDEYNKCKDELNNIKFGEFMMTIRRLLTKRDRTPNLYYIMQVMGKERVMSRLAGK